MVGYPEYAGAQAARVCLGVREDTRDPGKVLNGLASGEILEFIELTAERLPLPDELHDLL